MLLHTLYSGRDLIFATQTEDYRHLVPRVPARNSDPLRHDPGMRADLRAQTEEAPDSGADVAIETDDVNTLTSV